MILLLPLVLMAFPAHAREFVDSARRRVMVPDHVARVMAANQAGAVIVFVLTPEKLVGWPQPLSRRQRAYLPAKYARLPAVGPIGLPDPARLAAIAERRRPDLIVEMSLPSPARAAAADEVQRLTGVPYIVLDADINDASEMLRKLGTILGVDRRGRDLRNYVEHALSSLRGKLLIRPADQRPRVYFGLGRDGLETGLPGSPVMEDIDEAGAINVAARLGPPGGIVRVTPAQIVDWDPQIIIADSPSFYNALRRGRFWRRLSAVRNKHVYLAPGDPFGWITDPPGVNRVIGLYWLASILYPTAVEQDLRSLVGDFYGKFYGTRLSAGQLEALVRFAEANPGDSKRPANVPLLGAEPPPTPGLLPHGPLPMHPPGRGGLPNMPAFPNTPGATPGRQP